mgnify:CR=1 FL=1
MYRRICILVLTVLAAVSVCFARTAGPGMRGPEITSPNINSPDGFKPDSLNTATSERNQRLYDSIQSKTNRRAVPRMLYRMLFVKPVLDTTFSGRVVDESRLLEPYAGKTVGDITIERQHPFDSDGNWLERTGNKIHMLTRDRVIRRDLLFKPGDKIDPQLIVRNKQLLRSRPYISDVDITLMPDSLDSTRVNMVICTRDSWTISVDGAIHGEGRTMVGLSDANIFGWGNTLKFNTNFSRKDFSYDGEDGGCNIVEYEIPNVLGSFYTADFSAGRDFYNSELNMGLRKEFIRPTDYEIGLTYSDVKSKRYMIDLDTSLLIKVRNLDAWGEHFHFDVWMQVFRDLGLDPAFYANRRRPLDETLPWDHLDYGVTKAFLAAENRRAHESKTTPNCRQACSGCGAACWKRGVCVDERHPHSL